MATLQSQINILVASLAQLYDDVKDLETTINGNPTYNNPFSLVKLNYISSSITENTSFQALPTYVLAMDIDNDFRCTQYDVSLGVYKSTVDGHTFEYVVPEKYTTSNFVSNLDSFTSEFIHGKFSGDNNLKILLNFPQLISLGSDLMLNPVYVNGGNTTDSYNSLIYCAGESISKTRPASTQQHTEVTKRLRNMQTQLESQPEETCIDLVNENFESILYNNVYKLTENGNLTLKEHTNHPLKKHLTLQQSDYTYILDCDSNLKYHIE